MKMIDGYVKIMETEIPIEKKCKIINFFSWFDGTHTLPVALVMMMMMIIENGEIHQYPATKICFKLKSEEPNTYALH